MRTLLEIYEKPHNGADIQMAIELESRMRMHHIPQVELTEIGIDMHLKMVGGLIPEDAFKRYKQLFITPLPTNELLDAVFSEQKRIFDGNNGRCDVLFDVDSFNEDFEPFIFDIEDWIRSKGWDLYKAYYNSVIVVDIEQGDSTRLNPVIRVVKVDAIHDVELDKKGNIEYIMYKISKDSYAYIDKEKYAKFDIVDGAIMNLEESMHMLDYTPASFFWHSTHILKKHPNIGSLHALDMLLFSIISKEYNELFCKYIQMWTYEQADIDENLGQGDLPYIDNKFSAGHNMEGINNINMGPGKIHMIPANSDISGAPVGFVSSPIDSLKYISEDVEMRKENVFLNLCGVVNESSKEALNEKQVMSGFESRKNVLMKIKKPFEMLEEFLLMTFAKLRYGVEPEVAVDYGDEFYLQDINSLNEMFMSAKTSGAPQSELMRMYEQIVEHKYRNMPNLSMRAMVLLRVEPYPFMTVDEALKVGKEKELWIKYNFEQLIDRYENEVESISIAVKTLTERVLIEDIKTKLNEYYLEQETENENEEIEPPIIERDSETDVNEESPN